MNKLPEVVEEHVMRCQVTGGFVDVRYRHEMTAEDVGDLVGYLEMWEQRLLKREVQVVADDVPSPAPLRPLADETTERK